MNAPSSVPSSKQTPSQTVGPFFAFGLLHGGENILTDDEVMESYFENQPLILAHIQKIREKGKASVKAHDLETLAFHIITMPEMVDLFL